MVSDDPKSAIPRRVALKRLGAGVAVAWTVPVVTSLRVPAYAQVSPGPADVPYGSCGWRFKQVEHGGDPGFQSGPEPAGFSSGCAAFGNDPTCPAPHQTEWDTDTDMLLRRTVTIPPDTIGVTVGVAIDNDVTVYWDGVPIGSGVHDGCAVYDNFVFSAPPAAGDHLLAVRGLDRGGVTFLDVSVRLT